MKTTNKTAVVLASLLLGVMIVSAALVTYYSNTVTTSTETKSPLTSEILNAVTTGFTQDITFDSDSFTASIYGGEAVVVDADLTNNANATITGLLGEIRISSADITTDDLEVYYEDSMWNGNIPLCTDGTDVYAYIGDPTTGYEMTPGSNNPHVVTITFDQSAVGTYTAESKVIDLAARVC